MFLFLIFTDNIYRKKPNKRWSNLLVVFAYHLNFKNIKSIKTNFNYFNFQEYVFPIVYYNNKVIKIIYFIPNTCYPILDKFSYTEKKKISYQLRQIIKCWWQNGYFYRCCVKKGLNSVYMHSLKYAHVGYRTRWISIYIYIGFF